jgi:hypothetical protein
MVEKVSNGEGGLKQKRKITFAAELAVRGKVSGNIDALNILYDVLQFIT